MESALVSNQIQDWRPFFSPSPHPHHAKWRSIWLWAFLRSQSEKCRLTSKSGCIPPFAFNRINCVRLSVWKVEPGLATFHLSSKCTVVKKKKERHYRKTWGMAAGIINVLFPYELRRDLPSVSYLLWLLLEVVMESQYFKRMRYRQLSHRQLENCGKNYIKSGIHKICKMRFSSPY